eukprot:scaffold102444_cov32-Tisochrysis_lutea.AAC.4
MLDAGPSGSAGTTVSARDDNVICLSLGYAGGDNTHTNLGHKLNGYSRSAIGRLEVVDELRQVLDRIDVVMRWRRNEADTRCGAPRLGYELGHLVPGQLAALAGLSALRHLDLDFVGVCQVFGGDTETAGGDLLDRRAPVVLEPKGVLTTLTGIRFAAERVHRNGERLMCLARDRAEGHRTCAEAAHYLLCWLNLINRNARDVRAEGEHPTNRSVASCLNLESRSEGGGGREEGALAGA